MKLQRIWITVIDREHCYVQCYVYSFMQYRRFDIRLVGIHPGQEPPWFFLAVATGVRV